MIRQTCLPYATTTSQLPSGTLSPTSSPPAPTTHSSPPSTLRLVKGETDASQPIVGLLSMMAQPRQAARAKTVPHLHQVTQPTKVHHLQHLTAQMYQPHTPRTTEAGLAFPSDVPTTVIAAATTAAAGVVAVAEVIAADTMTALHPSAAGQRATSI